jgi:cysteinyl-tRNA synthetase
LHEPEKRVSKKATAEGEELRYEFWAAAAEDLNIPAALAVAWRVARSRLPGAVKRELLLDFDRLLGLELGNPVPQMLLPEEVAGLVRERQGYRRLKEYERADKVRERVTALGYEVRDRGRAASATVPFAAWKRETAGISSSRDVASHLEEKPGVEWTVGLVARRGPKELVRCVKSVRRWLGKRSAEIIVIDNGFDEDDRAALQPLLNGDARVGILTADHFLGAGAGRNIALRQARGHYVVLIDTSVEVKGDVFERLESMLGGKAVGIAGCWGAMTEDLRSFEAAEESGDVHAVEGYLMAFRRDVLRKSGWMDEKFRFYRHLDLDFSFCVRSLGLRAVIDTTLPVVRHKHMEWESTPVEERNRLSKRNYYRFLRKWEDRPDLAGAPGR